MDSLGDLLNKKAAEIDLDRIRAESDIAQGELGRFFSAEQARIIDISDKTVTIMVRNSVLASEARLTQVSLLESLSKALDRTLSKLYIRTGSL